MNPTDERFSRLSLLLGEVGLAQLNKAKVMVLGLGGVGGSCCEALARGGVGSLVLIDRDVVELSNINRQAIAFSSTIGQAKVEVATRMVAEINPACRVESRKVFLNKDNIDELLSSFIGVDYVIDCIDTVMAKVAVAEWCARHEVPLLSAMGAANKIDPQFLTFSTIEKTYNCPLSRAIRSECKRRGIRNLEVIFSSQPPQAIRGEKGRDKAKTLGTMSYMPPIMGLMLAGKVLRRLSGLEEFRQSPQIKEPSRVD